MARLTYFDGKEANKVLPKDVPKRRDLWYSDPSGFGKGYINRATYGPARTSPSPDPKDPYENNKWKLGMANKIYKNMLGCQKEWFNHSWKWRKMAGVEDDHSRFVHSSKLMAVNTALDTLNPDDGTYFQPNCWCIDIVTPDRVKFNKQSRYRTFAGGTIGHTGYDKTIGPQKKFGAAWNPEEWSTKTGFYTANGHSRLAFGPGWNYAGDMPQEMAVWFRYYFKNLSGTWHPWDCKAFAYDVGCMIKDCEGHCFSASFHPHGDPSNWCYYVPMKFSVCYEDGPAQFVMVGGGGGERFDVYLDGEKVGEIGDAEGDGQNTVAGFIDGDGLIKDKEPIFWDDFFEPCKEEYEAVLGITDGVEVEFNTGGRDCGAGCYDNLTQVFKFGEDVISRGLQNRPVFKIFYEVEKCECHGNLCSWPCGGVTIALSEDGETWYWDFLRPDIRLSEHGRYVCWSSILPINFNIRYIELNLSTNLWMNNCVCAKIKGVTAYYRKEEED